MTSLSFPNPEIGIETLVFGLMITFYAMMILAPSPAHALPSSSVIFFVISFSLPPLVSLARAVDGGGAV
jgi:hypothetical protein